MDSPPGRLRGIHIRTVNHFCPVCLGRLGRNPRGLWVTWRLYFGILPKTRPLYNNETSTARTGLQDPKSLFSLLSSLPCEQQAWVILSHQAAIMSLSFSAPRARRRGEEGEGWLKWPPIQKNIESAEGQRAERGREMLRTGALERKARHKGGQKARISLLSWQPNPCCSWWVYLTASCPGSALGKPHHCRRGRRREMWRMERW